MCHFLIVLVYGSIAQNAKVGCKSYEYPKKFVILQKQFLDYYDPTIEDQYIQHCEVDGNWVIMDVLDTAGQEEFSAMREQYMRNGRGFLLVYSVTERKSLDEAVKLYRQVLRVKDRTEYPVLLVANKDPPVNVDNAFHELVRIVKSFPSDEDDEEVGNAYLADFFSLELCCLIFRTLIVLLQNSNSVSPNRTKSRKKKGKQKCIIM
ncbi:unnamed protein product [Cylicostephanus goldi]|uniref:Ras family protein n=1 Tax=Cylicostephanus goldi TaxID=71465 RepID=A0A3P6QET9_CYLGO|nr:unnamed protein product [Cylicostephanus goldi]